MSESKQTQCRMEHKGITRVALTDPNGNDMLTFMPHSAHVRESPPSIMSDKIGPHDDWIVGFANADIVRSFVNTDGATIRSFAERLLLLADQAEAAEKKHK